MSYDEVLEFRSRAHLALLESVKFATIAAIAMTAGETGQAAGDALRAIQNLSHARDMLDSLAFAESRVANSSSSGGEK